MDIVGYSCLNCGFVSENSGSIEEPICGSCGDPLSGIVGEQLGQYNEFKVVYTDLYHRDRRTTVVVGVESFEDAYYKSKEKFPTPVLIERIVQL